MTDWRDEIHEDAPASELISERRLARRWDVSQRTLQRWRAENYGPAWIRIGGSIRYRFEDVLEYESAMRAGGK